MKKYPYSTQKISKDDERAVSQALRSDFLTQGARVLEFERQISKYTNTKHALAVNSATSALYAAYRAVLDEHLDSENSQKSTRAKRLNSEIFAITSPISFVATCNMLLQNGITPIFANILPNGNIDPKSVSQILKNHPKKEQIKLLVSVDYAGQSVDCTKLREIANEHKLFWISDSSHAFGAHFSESKFSESKTLQKVGNFADITIFSFHAIKPITTAEGGALVTNDTKIFERAKLIANHGVQKLGAWEYECVLSGFNFRMNELSSALGLSQIKKIEKFINKREKIACFYDDFFAQNAAHLFRTLPRDSRCKSTHHLYPIFLHKNLVEKKRDIFSALQKCGIEAQVHYRPIFDFEIYKNCEPDSEISQNARDFYNAQLSIPCAQNMSIKDAKKVAKMLVQIFEKFAK